MARIRARDTVPEKRVALALRSLRLAYRKHVSALPGTPDFANRRQGWAVFVHGCFWHSHEGCRRSTTPKTAREYWVPKLLRNQARDRDNQARLRLLGYRVLIVWECQTKSPADMHVALRPLSDPLYSMAETTLA